MLLKACTRTEASRSNWCSVCTPNALAMHVRAHPPTYTQLPEMPAASAKPQGTRFLELQKQIDALQARQEEEDEQPTNATILSQEAVATEQYQPAFTVSETLASDSPATFASTSFSEIANGSSTAPTGQLIDVMA